MKFDLIVGNPPYSIESNGAQRNRTPIYQKFFNLCFDHLNENGSMLWIQPDTWRNAYARDLSFQQFRHLMMRNCLNEIHLALEPWKSAQGSGAVAVIVDWFLLSKCNPGTTRVVSGESECEIVLSDYKQLNDLVAGRAAVNRIRKKLLAHTNAFIVNRTTYPPTQGSNAIAKKQQDETHCYPIACANRFSSGKLNAFAATPQREQFTPKVIVSLLRALNPTFDHGQVALGCDTAAFPVSSEEEAAFVIELLLSDPVQYVLATSGDTQYSRKGKNAGKRNRGAQWLPLLNIDFQRWTPSDLDFRVYFSELTESDWEEIKRVLG